MWNSLLQCLFMWPSIDFLKIMMYGGSLSNTNIMQAWEYPDISSNVKTRIMISIANNVLLTNIIIKYLTKIFTGFALSCILTFTYDEHYWGTRSSLFCEELSQVRRLWPVCMTLTFRFSEQWKEHAMLSHWQEERA